ncbi:MAG TPA: YsnF/AvaK domain-containing protein [Chthonomonadaceae bacterium]|nr:YsnF/AvaK domain-containing protein [Chthonomonadaceae bacterium]
MSINIYGLFNDRSTLQQLIPDLEQAGFQQSNLTTIENEGQCSQFQSLGIPQQDAFCLCEGVRRGGVVVVANADTDAKADQAAAIMRRDGLAPLDQCIAQWKQSGWKGANDRGEAVFPVVEEQLQIGKRQVDRGGVRVHTRIEEQPVQKDVNLRQEQVTVERRSVDRPATEADFAAARQGNFEVKETSEEPVVQKQARVVEEVAVGKQVQEHTQRVEDTVRRTDVQVEPEGKTTVEGQQWTGAQSGSRTEEES